MTRLCRGCAAGGTDPPPHPAVHEGPAALTTRQTGGVDRGEVGMTSRQAESWRRSGLIVSAEGEITQLRVIAALRRAGVSARRIRLLLQWLRATSEEPTQSLRFAIRGREVFVRHADGSWEGDANLGQLVMVFDEDDAPSAVDFAAWFEPARGPAGARGGPRRPARRPASPTPTGSDAIKRYLEAERRSADH